MPYKLSDKEKRNKELVEFAANRPDLTWKQVGALQKPPISGALAWLINKRWKEK